MTKILTVGVYDLLHVGHVELFRRAVEWCEAHGKQHVVLPRTAGVSTSGLKASIIQNN